MMRITLGALVLALGVSPPSRAADDAGADLLSRDDLCALAEGIARSRIQGLEGSSIADSSCTKSTATIDGRIALDVIVSRPVRMRPLQRGELCGMHCTVASPCGGDRRARFEKIDGHWKEVWNRLQKKPATN